MQTLARSTTLLGISLFPSFLAAQGWESLADVPEDLAFPVVVELQGNIHVVGGGAPTGASGIHLRYTPATDVWDTLALTPFRAQQPCGAVVDGKIHFAAGGYPNTGTPLADHAIYDPAADLWSTATDLPFPTAINEAASINDRFYVMTGQPDRRLCQSYDPATELWTEHADLPDMNFWYGAVLSAGNTIYRFGGGGYTAPNNLAHVYDAVNDSWTPLPPLPMAIHAVAGATINDNLICLAGGYNNGTDLDNMWLYHIDTQEYEALDPMPAGRSYHAMVYAGGCIYVVGGNNPLEPGIGTSLVRNCGIGVGLMEVGTDDALPYTATIFPTSLAIQLNENTPRHGATLEVMDAAGRRVQQMDLRSGSALLSATGIVPGVYRVRIHVAERRYVMAWVVQ